MFPIYKEVYTKVSKPLLFINSWSFHWPYNIRRILKLTKHLGKSTLSCNQGYFVVENPDGDLSILSIQDLYVNLSL